MAETTGNVSSVNIIVVTYNAEKWIEYFAGSLTALPENWKLVVVDNASQDNTCKIIAEQYPQIQLIKSESNLGFGKANNIALKQALNNKVGFTFLLNQDATISVDDIQKCINIYKENPDYYIVSPVHMNREGTELDRGFVFYALPERCPHLYADAITHRLAKHYETKYVNAAGWLLPLKTLQSIGGFNPIFMHYGEDDEYLARVVFHRGKIGIVPDALLYHDREFREESAEQKVHKKNRMLYKNSLVALCDLNGNITLKQFLKPFIKQAIMAALHLRVRSFIEVFIIAIDLIRDMPKIKKLKEQTAKKQPNFIA